MAGFLCCCCVQAYIEGPLNGFSPHITYIWAWGANYSVPLADVLDDGSRKSNQLLKILPGQLPEMTRHLFVLSVTAKNETSGLSSKATVEVHLSYPPFCEGVPISSGYSPCIQVYTNAAVCFSTANCFIAASASHCYRNTQVLAEMPDAVTSILKCCAAFRCSQKKV